ncbi:hypothetical protein [Ideonella sp.]|uniref:hypothetical protein n=1 Tax=Ideonella sp. TaxID=1929293 RepID=UPI003BB52377
MRLHPSAPPKPAPGDACNGCGVCCAAEPCPLGMLVSWRTRGPCVALDWADAAGQYRCSMVSDPRSRLPWLPKRLAPWISRLALRWISAASGCDAHWTPEAATDEKKACPSKGRP